MNQFYTAESVTEGHPRELAKARGTFPLFQESTLDQELPQRNATVTTIAPTGTLSLLASCSSGVEPIFGYVYIRNIMDGTEMIEVNPILREVLEERGLYSDELMKKIAKQGSLEGIEEIPEEIRRVFVSAHEVSPRIAVFVQVTAFDQNVLHLPAIGARVHIGGAAAALCFLQPPLSLC